MAATALPEDLRKTTTIDGLHLRNTSGLDGGHMHADTHVFQSLTCVSDTRWER